MLLDDQRVKETKFTPDSIELTNIWNEKFFFTLVHLPEYCTEKVALHAEIIA